MSKKKDKIKYFQKKKPGCQDSFFYDGDMARLGRFLLIATGDIMIRHKSGYPAANGPETSWSGKPDEPIFKAKNDKELRRLVGNEDQDKPFWWDANNWFEVLTLDDGVWNYEIGIVEYEYDDAIRMLKSYYENDGPEGL